MKDLNKNWLALSGDEEVVNWTHPSWYKFLSEVFFGLVMVAIGLYAIYLTHSGNIELSAQLLEWAQYGSYLFTFAGVLFILMTVVERYRMYYVVTTENIIKKTQVIANDPDYVPVNEIQMSRVRQENHGIDELLGYGHITLSTAATAGEESSILFVPEPYEFKRSIELAAKGVEPYKIRRVVDEDLTLKELNKMLGETEEDEEDDAGDGEDSSESNGTTEEPQN